MKETVEIRDVTVTEAKVILAKHEADIADGKIRNRIFNKPTGRKYSNDMRRGHWGRSLLIFDENNNMLDGRHRLWGQINSGTTQRYVILRTPAEFGNNGTRMLTRDTIDLGRPRMMAQQLHLDGLQYSTNQAAAMRVISIISTQDSDLKLSIASTRELIAYYPKTEFLIRTIGVNRGRGHNATGFFLGPVLMYHKLNPEKADEFIEGYVTGQSLRKGHPILALKTFYQLHPCHGQDGLWRAMNATALALQHFDRNSGINAIRVSEIGADWLRDVAKTQVKRVVQIVGADLEEIETE